MKRTISMLMCAVMLFTLSPFSFAEEATDVETIVTEMPAEGVPSEDVAEVPAEEVIVPEESGASDASPEPAAVTAPAEPTAEAAKPQTVRIVFICEPETAVVKVFDGAQQDEDENPLLLVPEEDGSYLLKEGEYLYDAAAEGYVFIEKEAFQVEAPETEEEVPEERKQEIRVTMSPVEVPVAAPLPFPLTEAEPEETAEPVALPEEPAEESPTTPAGIWIPSGAGLMPGLETTTAPADETVTEEPEEEPAVGAAGKESAEEPTAEAAFVEEPAEDPAPAQTAEEEAVSEPAVENVREKAADETAAEAVTEEPKEEPDEETVVEEDEEEEPAEPEIELMEVAEETATAEAANAVVENSTAAEAEEFSAEKFCLDREYLAMTVGESTELSVMGIPENWLSYVTWKAEDSGGVELSDTNIILLENAKVTAVGVGTAFATASIIYEGKEYKARCRIDVLEEAVVRETAGVSLLEKTATVELYKTDYTEVTVLLGFAQNDTTLMSVGGTQKKDNGIAIEKASFVDRTTAGYFDLRVRDDRTLEIIPTDSALQMGQKMKTAFSSAILIEGKSWQAETDVLKLTIKKSMPTIKATAVKFNSFVANEEQSIIFTGGTVSSITLDEGSKRGCPDWLTLDTDTGVLTLKDSAKDRKLTGKVWLYVTAEGWSETLPRPVMVNVSTVRTAPKLTFTPAAVTLNPSVGDTVSTTATVDMERYETSEITLSRITVGNKPYTAGDLKCEINGHTMTFSTETGFDAAKARTFKVYLKMEGVEYPVTVKTLAAAIAKTITVKATGTIDTAVPDSAVTLQVTPKGFSGASYTVSFTRYDAGTRTKEPAEGLFVCDEQDNVFTVTENPGTGLTAGVYYAQVSADVDGTTVSAEKKFTVKTSAANKVAMTVTLKAKGSLDVIRPDSSIVLTPTIKNAYGYVPNPDDLVFYRGTGKTAAEITDPARIPFHVTTDGTNFIITRKSAINHLTEKYSVGLRVKIAGRTGGTKTPLALTVKMGTAAITQSSKTVEILDRDRYSYGSLIIGTADTSLAPISKVKLDAKSDQMLELTMVGSNQAVLRYEGDQVTTSKNINAKLSVFLEGNESGKANATLAVTVKVIKVRDYSEVERTGWQVDFEAMEHGTAWCIDRNGEKTSHAQSGETLTIVPTPDEGYTTESVQYKKQSAADWTLLAAEPYTVAVEDEDIRIRVVFEQDQSLITTRIDDAHFPDNALRTLVKQFDTNADGSLGKEEKAAVRQLDCSNRGITSLKGIELFRELEVLNASNNSLTTVDLSRNRALTDIILAGNVSLTGITFPEGITAISNNAFKGCTALKAMDIPTTVTGIGESAFEGCTGLASVTLSDDVSTIGRAAFKNCSSLSSMSIAGAA